MNLLLFIVTTCVALMSGPKESTNHDTPVQQGKKVTLSVSLGEVAPKVVSAVNDSTISFKWEEGDMILITVRDTIYPFPDILEYYEIETSTAEFTLATGAGTANATFSGEMPGTSEYFEIQYPVISPNLASQTYEAGKISSGLMLFTATGCTLGAPATLESQSAVLQLNLFGIARSVSKIEVSNQQWGGVRYTLNCSEAVQVGKDKDHATPFYIVMNSENDFQLQVDVTMNELSPVASDLLDYETYGKGYPISSNTFAQSSSQNILAGTCINMPAVSLTTIWAPVNCGYDPVNFKYGKLYQWGRKDGCGYIAWSGTTQFDDAGGILQNCPNPGYVTSQIAAEDEDPSLYYNTTYNEEIGGMLYSRNTDWLSTKDNYRWDGTGGSEKVHFASKAQYDPCPDGWRVPTKAEMSALLGSNTSVGNFPTSTHGLTADLTGRWFNGSAETAPTTGVFLPVVGCRNCISSAACVYRHEISATYWTSSVSADRACSMGFGYSVAPSISTNSNRAGGHAVRCVQE